MASTEFSLFAYEEAETTKKEKSPNALRTISEAADMLDVPQHVLRFWETKFPQIKPLKRNGVRRFYRPQDIDILQQIKHLLYAQGYTIKGAKKAVDDFIHARATNEVSSDDWMAAIPPASVNDNFIDPPEPAVMVEESTPEEIDPSDMLAEIAEALAEPEPEVTLAVNNVIAPDFEALRAVRDELAALRDELVAQLPRTAAAIH